MRIRLDSLTKTYKEKNTEIRAVQNLSLSIPSDTVYGIIGKSGAGKSTLVRLIGLLEKPDAGSVLYDDVRVDNVSEKELIAGRRRIGMIFQNFNLFCSRNAGENVAYPLEIAGVSKRDIRHRTHELLDLVGLAGRERSPISTLSGGQKQRVAIARALANKPDVLLCDEATSALDPQTTRSILLLIRNLQKQMNLTVIMITHQMEVVRDICTSVAVLDDGCIAEQGKTADVFAHPKAALTKDFLAHLAVYTSSLSAETVSDAPASNAALVRWSNEGGKYTLRFIGNRTGEPVLSRASRLFNVEFNIRAGGIQHVSDEDIGTLITDINGSPKELQKTLVWLEEQGIIVETEGEKA